MKQRFPTSCETLLKHFFGARFGARLFNTKTHAYVVRRTSGIFEPGSGCLEPSTLIPFLCMVPVVRDSVSGTWYHVPGTDVRHLVPGDRNLPPGAWCLVPGGSIGGFYRGSIGAVVKYGIFFVSVSPVLLF